MNKLKVGLIGCGNISEIYLKNGRDQLEYVEIVACSDIDMNRANEKAEAHGIEALTVDELLTAPHIDMILNLTIPAVHAEVSLRALEAGKHVYLEKPLAIDIEDAKKVIDYAEERGLVVGCAPDTFLGGGIQTCKEIIDSGLIGQPVAATAFMISHGPESWHPNPEFFYQNGAGPLFDMGPYYITTLIQLIGSIKRVTSSAQISFPEREVLSEPNRGQKISVSTPTHVAGVLDFENGAVASMIMTFDVWGTNLPNIEIYGTLGNIRVPDPNTFGGKVLVRKAADSEWSEVPLTHGNTSNARGIGMNDVAQAILEKREPRASAKLAYHALEVMTGLLESSKKGEHYQVKSHCPSPQPTPSLEESQK
ncbi:putative dehydrogenase [Bacillus sp. TS-2]|nr:putative dehydrogenase [Bacillus sp. TS-2]